MKLRKAGRLAATFTLAAGLTLGAAACNDEKPADDSSTTTTTEVDPKTALMGSFDKLQNETYTMEMTVGDILTGNFQVDMSKTATAGTMHMDLAAADPQAAEMGMGTMDIEMISIGQDVWMKFGGDLGAMFGDGWLHSTTDSEQAQEFSQVDPSQMTQAMMDSMKDIKEVGPNKYTGTVDPAALGGVVGDDVEANVEPMELTITLTDDGMLQSIEAQVEGIKDGETVPMTISFSGYGEPVTIEAPPADQVTEMDEAVPGGM